MCSRIGNRMAAPRLLNSQQQRLFDYVTGRAEFDPIFVSGSAGTGKSALLVALRDHWQAQNKVVWVVSYTHLAARNVDGTTCHSTFGFDYDLNLTNKRVGVPNCLIIDEISMVPERMLDGIDQRLRAGNRRDLPFGGVNTLAFGDLYQLPPVNDRRSRTRNVQILPPYFSKTWTSFRLYELTENMRQSERDFIEALNMLRVGDRHCQAFFDDKVLTQSPTMRERLDCTTLVSTHAEADRINAECYAHIRAAGQATPEYTVELGIGRNVRTKNGRVFNKSQETLIFKADMRYCAGTRVMVTHNTHMFCNGDMGVVVAVEEEKGVLIRREYDGNEMWLRMVELAFETESYHTVRLVSGLPICYGWAVTIHKAQGMTVSNLIVHPERIFVAGQAYVAMSRVTHCAGLKLCNKIPGKSIVCMRDVKAVYERMNRLCIDDTRV